MGWLLIGNPKKGKKRKPTKADLAERKRRWAIAIKSMALVMAITGVAMGWYYGEDYLGKKVGQERKVDEPIIDFVNKPIWCPLGRCEHYCKHRCEKMEKLIREIVSADPLEHDSLTKAEQALAKHPWIESVDRLVRKPGGIIEVYARYREPAALVSWAYERGDNFSRCDGFRLIDAEGYLLPGAYPFDQQQSLGLIAIVNAQFPAPEVGQLWPGDDLAAGLKLVKLLVRQPFAHLVAHVDVSNFNGRQHANEPHLIVTARNDKLSGKLGWGRAPGDEGSLEPSPDAKIKVLMENYEKYNLPFPPDKGGINLTSESYLTYPRSSPQPLR